MQIKTESITIGELELIQWQYGSDMGHFKRALWEAIQRADSSNLKRLALGFPEQVTAYLNYSTKTEYWQELLTRAGLVKEKPQPPEHSSH